MHPFLGRFKFNAIVLTFTSPFLRWLLGHTSTIFDTKEKEDMESKTGNDNTKMKDDEEKQLSSTDIPITEDVYCTCGHKIKKPPSEKECTTKYHFLSEHIDLFASTLVNLHVSNLKTSEELESYQKRLLFHCQLLLQFSLLQYYDEGFKNITDAVFQAYIRFSNMCNKVGQMGDPCLKYRYEHTLWALTLLKERGVALLKDLQEICTT